MRIAEPQDAVPYDSTILKDFHVRVLRVFPGQTSQEEMDYREEAAKRQIAMGIADFALANPEIMFAVDELEVVTRFEDAETIFSRKILRVKIEKIKPLIPRRIYNLKERIKILFTGKL